MASPVAASASKKNGGGSVEEEHHQLQSRRGAPRTLEWKRSGGGVAPKLSGGKLK
jgi:hypothetical protein